jgi:hypothetical protein
VNPTTTSEFNSCIQEVAAYKSIAVSSLFESVEQEVIAKLEFIQGQQEQLKQMKQNIETMIESRDVIEQAKHVIFGKVEEPSYLSGETNQVGEFLNDL